MFRSISLAVLLLAAIQQAHAQTWPDSAVDAVSRSSNLARESRFALRDPANALVIPESAFQAAMLEKKLIAADPVIQNRGRQLGALGNRAASLGIIAPITQKRRAVRFSGTTFIVVRDPVILAGGRGVEARNYFVAVVELSGTSPWVGGNARVLLGSNNSSGRNVCCGRATTCVTPPATNGPCGPDTFCNPEDVGVSHTGNPALDERKGLGQPIVNVQLYGGSFTGVPQECVTTINPQCGVVLPVCGPGDEGFTLNDGGTADVPVGSSSCGNNATRPAEFSNVPLICQMALTSGEGPFCGGLTHHGPPLLADAQDAVPPACRVALTVEGSNMCMRPGEKQALRDLEQLALRAQFVGGVGSRCQLQGNGVQFCTTCTAERCTQTAERTMTLISENTRTANFDPTTVTGKCHDAAGAEVSCAKPKEKPESTPAPAPANPPPATPAPSTPATPAPQQPAQPQNGDPPPPGPAEPKPKPEHPPREFFPDPPTQGDPIAVGSGALQIDVADLHFEGAVRALEFRRAYSSQSDVRSFLGSNWTHNWDVRVKPITLANADSWMLPYCAGSAGRPSCLVMSRGDGFSEIFYLDYGTMLYMPQAGSTTTIAATSDGGWAARSPDGRLLVFDADGALLEDRDRFGNGLNLTHEATPLARVFNAFCNPAALVARNESLAARRCAVLTFMVGRGQRPLPGDAWAIEAADFATLLAQLPGGAAANADVAYGLDYLLAIIAMGPTAQPAEGGRMSRLTTVTDDLGRRLQFEYTQATAGAAGTLDFSLPEVERLSNVHGPAGTSLHFEYGRPVDYAVGANESFLVRVARHDTPTQAGVVAAVDRETRYEYEWPGAPADSYTASRYFDDITLVSEVYDRYLAYYRSYIGCAGKLSNGCGAELGLPGIIPGDPAVLARIKQAEYMGRVADNIVTVYADAQIESETRYEPNPWQVSFDHASAQRFGSTLAVAAPGTIVPDATSDRWRTQLPKAVFDYSEAGPRAPGGDLTADFLPAEIRQRYPLEAAENDNTVAFPQDDVFSTPVKGAPELASAQFPSCSAEQSRNLFRTLPGWRRTLDYYDAPAPATPVLASGQIPVGSIRILRTRLDCDTLAVNQLGDPAHNDLVSSLTPDLSTTDILSDHFATRITGRRRMVSLDVNRVCGWTRFTDRDGDTSYFGLNYRGQALLEARARRNQGGWSYFEFIYNADGYLVEERRPTRGTAAWTMTAGLTAFRYDEIDPSANAGWNGWLPAFWARRANLLRIETRAAGNGVVDLDETTGAVSSSVGRYQSFAYEPFFNQQARLEGGALVKQGPALVDVPSATTQTLFDFQEASSFGPAFNSLLDRLRPWGYNWLRLTNGDYDYAGIASFQLPIAFYGQDLNDDGVTGVGFAPAGELNVRSVAARIEQRGSQPVPVSITTFVWAPHGLPAQVTGTDGATTVYRFYKSASATNDPLVLFGNGTIPGATQASSSAAGLVAEVRRSRFGLDYPNSAGPNSSPCALLRGPYQWLLPATCTNAPQELAAIGLPPATVDAVLASSDPTNDDRWRSAAATYTALGEAATIWSEGRSTRFVRDTDGRVVERTDPLGNVQRVEYSPRGMPLSERWLDSGLAQLSYQRSEFDAEDRPTSTCIALEIGGCAQPGTGTAQQEAVSRATFYPEGQLARSVDPDGLLSEYSYDESGHLTVLRARTRGPAAQVRTARFTYNLDGQLSASTYGNRLPALLGERIVYDGLQRPTEATDIRGTQWYSGYSRRDLVVRHKADVRGFGVAGAAPIWETALEYDPLGRLLLRRENGTEVQRVELTDAGLPAREYRLGQGVVHTTFDSEGNPAWSSDGVGTQQVFTMRPQALERTHATLHRCCDPQRRLNIATIEKLDAMGRVREAINWGSGDEQHFNFVRDGLGNVREQRDPLGLLTRFERNLVGWPRRVFQQSSLTTPAAFDVSTYTYDGSGRTTSLVDPSGQISRYSYSGFGELTLADLPGTVRALRRFEYDELGRLRAEERAGARIQYEFDARGDSVTDRLMGSRSEIIAARTFDALGRLRDASESNPALTWLPRPQRLVTTSYRFDTLGRLRLESTRIGNQTPRSITYTWTVSNGSLRQDVVGPAGSQLTWSTRFDAAQRVMRKEWTGAGGQAAAQFSWLGTSLAEHSTRDGQHMSPLAQLRELDKFGATIGWQYRGIRLDTAGRPLDATEAQEYCGPRWEPTQCGAPLLSIAVLRDLKGRAVSTQSRLGAPVFSGATLTTATRRAPWRGVEYTALGALQTVWEQEGVTRPISTSLLRTNNVSAADINALGTAGAATQWQYQRQTTVGDTTRIADAGSAAERWSHMGPYAAGHQISQVRVGGQTRAIQFDLDLRISRHGNRMLRFDPRGALARVDTGGALSEAYLHDSRGRVVRSITNTAASAFTDLVYDEHQMIVAYGPGGARLWSALWGPQLDQLLEWTDAAGISRQPLADDRNSVVAAWRVDTSRLSSSAEYSPEGRVTVRAVNGTVTCTEAAPGANCALPAQSPFGLFSAFRSPRTGLVYLRNRWYSPELGQFMSSDAKGYEDSFNPYAFVGFDPISGRDPFGLGAEDMWWQRWLDPPIVTPRSPVRLVPDPVPSPPGGYPPRTPMLPQFLRAVGNLAAAIGPRLVGVAAFLTPSNMFTNYTECADGFCKKADQTDSWDTKTRQPVRREEMDARASLKRPDYKPSDYSGPNHKGKQTRPDSDPNVCAYCGNAAPETVEHILARVSWFDLLKDEGLTEQEAKEGADDITNLIKVCGRCNSSKSSKDLGINWNPKNPNDLVKQLIKLFRNPNTRWLLRNLATAKHAGIAAVVGGAGLASAPAKAGTPSSSSGQPGGGSSPNSCTPKDFTCH